MNLDQLEKIKSMAVVGATGLVGRELLEILAENKIKIPLKLMASANSLGETVFVGSSEHPVRDLAQEDFEGVDVAVFSVPKEISLKYIPQLVERGVLVVDDSNAFRMEPEVPLVVPQVNGEELECFSGKLIAIPNCSTTPVAMALKPLSDRYGLERVVVSTYQSVSGAGRQANEELQKQVVALLNGSEIERTVFAHRIAFNCLPLIGEVDESGESDEEVKVRNELRKILDLPDLRVSATAVRVPTFCGHGISVNVELREDFDDISEVRELMEAMDGIRVIDNPKHDVYPTNTECVGSGDTFVGRLRRDPSVNSGVNFWVIADNLRKGAALNALEIVNTYLKSHGELTH